MKTISVVHRPDCYVLELDGEEQERYQYQDSLLDDLYGLVIEHGPVIVVRREEA